MPYPASALCRMLQTLEWDDPVLSEFPLTAFAKLPGIANTRGNPLAPQQLATCCLLWPAQGCPPTAVATRGQTSSLARLHQTSADCLHIHGSWMPGRACASCRAGNLSCCTAVLLSRTHQTTGDVAKLSLCAKQGQAKVKAYHALHRMVCICCTRLCWLSAALPGVVWTPRRPSSSSVCLPAAGSLSPDAQYSRGQDFDGAEHENPAKFLLYRPAATELLAVLATTCETLPPVSVMLLAISAAGELLAWSAKRVCGPLVGCCTGHYPRDATVTLMLLGT